jgi:hypothetical protein
MSTTSAKKNSSRRVTVDAATRARHEVLAAMEKMSESQLLALAIRAGIYTQDGQLTPPYREETPLAARRTRQSSR